MRNRFADKFYALGKEDPRLAIVVADISPAGALNKFRAEFPDRFLNVGVAEQVMIGIAAGMAMRGMRPFAYTIATFSIFRPFEFVRDDLCYQDLPVTVVGMSAGVTYSTLGGTHHAMEDIAITTAIPNMQVVAPCDPPEADEMTEYLARESMKPTYMRIGKAGEPTITNGAEKFRFGKIRYLRRGDGVCVMSFGATCKKAMDVADRLRDLGESTSVVSVHTLKPLDKAGVIDALRTHRQVIVIEEHVPHGGLGPRVKEIAWDAKATCRIDAFSLQDEFIHHYGDHEQLLEQHGLGVNRIVEKVRR